MTQYPFYSVSYQCCNFVASSITDHEANLNLKEEKKYLGGFRHVKTEQVFHHAATQVRYLHEYD